MATSDGSVIISIDGDASGFEEELDNVTESAEAFGDTSRGAINSLAQAMVAAGIAGKVRDIATALYDCVDTFAAFEQQMSAVQSISGATAEEMAALSEKAKEMGATTSFTATEAGKALEYMAMAGWDSQKMMDGLPGIMNLAAASGEDLAMVSDIVTDGLTAFGLSADESAHFADVLAKASAKSNTNVGMLGESFKYVAPVAGSLGMSIEDVAVALGLMANAGIKGSMSGTALRSMLTRLAKPTKMVSKYADELGISLTDNNGKMRTLSELMELLREKFKGLTEAQQAEYAAGIAGQESMSGLLAIINASDEDFQLLTASINNCAGAAQEMAEIRLDNYAGQVTLLDSALDGLKMTIGSQLAPVLKLMAKGATTAVGGLNMLLERCPALSAILAGLVASAGAFVTALTGFQMLKLITPMVKAFNVALAANPAGAAAIAIVGVVTALGTLAAYCIDATSGVGTLNQKMKEINGTYEQNKTQTLATAEAANSLIDRLVALESQENMTAGEAALYAQTVDQLKTMMPDLNIEIDEQTGLLIGGAEALRVQTEAWKENALAQAMQEKYKAVLEGQAEALIDVAEKQIGYNDALATCTDIERQMQETSSMLAKVEKDSSLTAEEKSNLIGELSNRMGELSGKYVTAKDNLNAQDAAMKKAKETADAYDSEIEELNKTQEALIGTLQDGGAAMQDFEGYAGSVVDKMQSLEEAYMESASAAKESFEEQFDLWEDLSGKVEDTSVSLMDAMRSQEQYWNDLSRNLDSLSQRNIDGLEDVVNAINDGSTKGSAYIADMATKSDAELQRIVEQYQDLMAAQDSAAGSTGNWASGYSRQVHDLSNDMVNAVQTMNLYGPAMQAGSNTIQGYIDGLNSRQSDITTSMRRAANDGWSAFKRTIGIASPSKAFRESGKDSIEGYELGIEDRTAKMQQTMKKSALGASESFQSQLDVDVSSAKIGEDIQKKLQSIINDVQLAVMAEVSGFSNKLAVSADPLKGYTAEPSTITNDNGIVINLTYNGTSEPEDVRKISRQIGAETARELRRRGIPAT